MQVLITIDTESYLKGHPNGQIWGRVLGESDAHGITRIMDLLEANNTKGVFFLTPYEQARHGVETLADAAREIHKRGHDLQLHTHPIAMFRTDYMSRFDEDEQVEILQTGMDLLKQWTGKTVTAHRAGGFHADANTLKACARVGINLDASCSPYNTETPLAHELNASLQVSQQAGVWELPMTEYHIGSLGNRTMNRLMDIEASSLSELKAVVTQARDHGLEAVTLLMHSFSFVRDGTVNHQVERRFEQFLQFVNNTQGVEFATTETLQSQLDQQAPQAEQPAGFRPRTGWVRLYFRCVEQFGESWKNRIVALAPLPPVLAAAAWWAWV